jgi:hypothetical protein
MFGDSWWTARIDNTGSAVATILAVDVTALDMNGFEAPHGCTPANNTVPVDDAFDRSIRAALSGLLRDGIDQSLSHDPGNRPVPVFNQTIRDAMVAHLPAKTHG